MATCLIPSPILFQGNYGAFCKTEVYRSEVDFYPEIYNSPVDVENQCSLCKHIIFMLVNLILTFQHESLNSSLCIVD